MWRTTPVHRWELSGSLPDDAPPALPADLDADEIQPPDDGAGPLMHRLYRVRVRTPRLSADELIERIAADVNAVAPLELASFEKVEGDRHELAVNDEYVVRMPAPWDGPVRVAAVTPTSFRLATLQGHLEAGQIEFRAGGFERGLEVVIESWARSADRLSDLLYARARMAKEVQLYIWTSVLERIVALAGGVRDGGIVVTTRRVDEEDRTGGTGPQHARARRRLAALATTGVNYDPSALPQAGGDGWRLDDMVEPLPAEPPGPPLEGGSWQVARRLMLRYQVADPRLVRATYRPGSELAGRDMLLTIRFAGLRFSVGVRVGDVHEETRRLGGREARVFGWDYRTLEGHFEQGQMHYEVWKWLGTGEVEFRLRAVSRVADSGPLPTRLGFRLLGRSQQLAFYRQACRRMLRLTESELETERIRSSRAAAS
jgi:hypothetical protein